MSHFWTIIHITVFAYILKNKSEVFEKFKQFKAFAEKQTGYFVKALRCDNGREYLSNNFINYLAQEGIDMQLTVPYNPQSNGCAERINRTFIDGIRSLLVHSNLNQSFWTEALNNIVHVRNRTPVQGYKNTPYELFYNRKPDVSYFRTFGCECFIHNDKPNQSKLTSRANKSIFLGYKFGAFRVFDCVTNKIVVARNNEVFGIS